MTDDFDGYPTRDTSEPRDAQTALADALDSALNDFGWIPDPSFKRAGTHRELATAILTRLRNAGLTVAPALWTLISPYNDEAEHGRQSSAGTHLFTVECKFCAEGEIERLKAELEDAYRTIRAYIPQGVMSSPPPEPVAVASRIRGFYEGLRHVPSVAVASAVASEQERLAAVMRRVGCEVNVDQIAYYLVREGVRVGSMDEYEEAVAWAMNYGEGIAEGRRAAEAEAAKYRTTLEWIATSAPSLTTAKETALAILDPRTVVPVVREG